eukprot:1750647-Karenia_brevis.AAC.1
MLAEEVHRMCTTNPHLQAGGNDSEMKNKIVPAVPCVISCHNLNGITSCGSDIDKQGELLSQIDEVCYTAINLCTMPITIVPSLHSTDDKKDSHVMYMSQAVLYRARGTGAM